MLNEFKSPHLTPFGFIVIYQGKVYEFPTEEEFDEFIEEHTQCSFIFQEVNYVRSEMRMEGRRNRKDIYLKREWVRNAYQSEEWKKKVDAMPDSQVVAIWYSIHEQRAKRKARIRREAGNQVSIFDYMGVKRNEKKIFNKLV